MQDLLDDGFPIEVLTLQDAPGYTTGGFGIGSVVDPASLQKVRDFKKEKKAAAKAQ